LPLLALCKAWLIGNRVQSLHELISAKSGCEGFGRLGYDDPCLGLERDSVATEGQQRDAKGWRRKSIREFATLIGRAFRKSEARPGF